MSRSNVKPVAAVVGTAFVASLASVGIANADANPFQALDLADGYNLAKADAEGKCGEGKCGEGKCGGAA